MSPLLTWCCGWFYVADPFLSLSPSARYAFARLVGPEGREPTGKDLAELVEKGYVEYDPGTLSQGPSDKGWRHWKGEP